MRRRERFLLAALAALSLYLCALGAAAQGARPERASEEEQSPAAQAAAAPEAEPETEEAAEPASPQAAAEGYVLRAVEGEICLCLDGTVVLRTGVAAATLPREDRAALEEGIAVRSREELAALLEDLSS